MGHWANRTSTMITITICLLLLVAGTGLYAGYTNFVVQQDAQIINELGKIRGGAQRLVHFALAGEAGEQMYAEIEAIMASFRDHPQFGNQVSVLEDAWRELKQTILAYQAEPTLEGHHELFQIAERLWILSNELVLAAQRHAESKVHNYNYIVASFVVCIILIGALRE
jgi:nitrate/nitrite-specific signal transduction histidine kinase